MWYLLHCQRWYSLLLTVLEKRIGRGTAIHRAFGMGAAPPCYACKYGFNRYGVGRKVAIPHAAAAPDSDQYDPSGEVQAFQFGRMTHWGSSRIGLQRIRKHPAAAHEDVIPRKAPRDCVPMQQIPRADRGIQPRLLRCRFSAENMRTPTVRASTKRLAVRRVDSSVGAGVQDEGRVQRGASFGMTVLRLACNQNRRTAKY
jgi:hypothetical protein